MYLDICPTQYNFLSIFLVRLLDSSASMFTNLLSEMKHLMKTSCLHHTTEARGIVDPLIQPLYASQLCSLYTITPSIVGLNAHQKSAGCIPSHSFYHQSCIAQWQGPFPPGKTGKCSVSVSSGRTTHPSQTMGL